MERKIRGGVNVGTRSVLVSFMLLCMVCFAALTYVTASSDYALSLQTAQRTTEYYDANRLAELYMTNIEGLLSKHVKSCTDADEFYSSIPALFSDNDSVTVSVGQEKGDPTLLSYTVPINETLELRVTLNAHFPDIEDHSVFNIESWNTVSIR